MDSSGYLWLLQGYELPECGSFDGQRVLPLDFLKSIELPSGFGLEFKLTLEAVRRGYEVIEVPVDMRHRETGRNISGFMHRGKQCIDIIDIIRNEMKRL